MNDAQGQVDAREVWRELEARLGHPVFEVPTLPPSVPGIRVFETMTSALRRQGTRLVIGNAVSGGERSNAFDWRFSR